MIRKQKTLEIYLDEECLICPNLSLVTDTIYTSDGGYVKEHRCVHTEFCSEVRRAWEEARGEGLQRI